MNTLGGDTSQGTGNKPTDTQSVVPCERVVGQTYSKGGKREGKDEQPQPHPSLDQEVIRHLGSPGGFWGETAGTRKSAAVLSITKQADGAGLGGGCLRSVKQQCHWKEGHGSPLPTHPWGRGRKVAAARAAQVWLCRQCPMGVVSRVRALFLFRKPRAHLLLAFQPACTGCQAPSLAPAFRVPTDVGGTGGFLTSTIWLRFPPRLGGGGTFFK